MKNIFTFMYHIYAMVWYAGRKNKHAFEMHADAADLYACKMRQS